MPKPDGSVELGLPPDRLLALICILNVLGLLYAGLKPFHSPVNGVTWLSGANGLRFGEFGVIFSGQPVQPPPANVRSLEIWIQPAQARDSNTILAFYDPEHSRRLSLRQSISDLKLEIASSSAWFGQKTSNLYVKDAFGDRKNTFWTITSGPGGTSIYRDGVLVKASRQWRISSEAFSGRLVFGTSPIFNSNWSGTLHGLAIYDRLLSEPEIRRHYQTWTSAYKPEIYRADSCIAFYLFNEHSGREVHNRLALSTGLIIPPRYMILNQTVLDPVWRAFNWSWGFWQDAFINLAGFVPPCFFFCAYLSARKVGKPALMASLVGAAISLLIELVQSNLPTRDSSMADVFNNAIGSAVGAIAYRGTFARMFNRSLDWGAQLLLPR